MSKEEKKEATKKKTANEKNKQKASKNTSKNTNKNTKEVKVIKEEKKVVKEEKTSNDKIKKIQEKAKKETKMPKTAKSKKENFVKFFTTKNEKWNIICGFIGGLLLGLLIMVICMPDRIATLEDGTQPVASIDGKTITADELYEDMKDYYSVQMLLNTIDTSILNELYEEDDEMDEKVNSNAEYYLNAYNSYYGYSEDEALEAMGFSTYNQFLEALKLDYRKNKYLEDYIKENLTDSEIETYYKENVYGDINCQHILVATSDDDGLTDDEAKSLAQEIITKLNDGTSWEDIQEEYKDQITYEDLGYQSWDASLESTFLDALKDMDENSFSTEPVQTSYGYHVIYKLDQKDTPSLDDVKDTIIENLVDEKEDEDEDLQYKALISLRKEHNLEFSDTVLKEKYEKYCKQYK
jgi:foldase protein PrsA